MHPPFGFALFYLRGISDTLFKNKSIPRPIASRDIYLGAIPWLCMQLLLVAIVIFVPLTVTIFINKEVAMDIDKIRIDVKRNDSAVPDERMDRGDPFGTQK